MSIIDQIAEAQIRAAIERGELSNLPGEGKPLPLEDTLMIPEELRAAYRLLKNAGFLPPEVQARKDIAEAEQLLLQINDPGEHCRARARLELLRMRLDASRRHSVSFQLEDEYYRKLLERMEHSDLESSRKP